MEACLKAEQRNGPCIMLTVIFKFQILCIIAFIAMGPYFLGKAPYWVLIRSVF